MGPVIEGERERERERERGLVSQELCRFQGAFSCALAGDGFNPTLHSKLTRNPKLLNLSQNPNPSKLHP